MWLKLESVKSKPEVWHLISFWKRSLLARPLMKSCRSMATGLLCQGLLPSFLDHVFVKCSFTKSFHDYQQQKKQWLLQWMMQFDLRKYYAPWIPNHMKNELFLSGLTLWGFFFKVVSQGTWDWGEEKRSSFQKTAFSLFKFMLSHSSVRLTKYL